MPGDVGMAPSPILVTPLLPLGCTVPMEATTRGHAGLPDPQMPPAADWLLLRALGKGCDQRRAPDCAGASSCPTWWHGGRSPTQTGRGWLQSQRLFLRDLTASTELLPRPPESQRSPQGPHSAPTSTLQPSAHEDPLQGPPAYRVPPLMKGSDTPLCRAPEPPTQ